MRVSNNASNQLSDAQSQMGGEQVFAKQGDMLADVAERYGVEEGALRQANPDTREPLLAGEPLRLPEANAPQSSNNSDTPLPSQVHKEVDEQGRVTYSDRPQTNAQDQAEAGTNQPVRTPHEHAVDLIRAAQKHGAKIDDYVKELGYLRHHNPVKLDAVFKEIKHSNPELWIELQKNPAFKELSRTFSVTHAGERYLEAGINVVTKGEGAALEKYSDGTLKTLIKRDAPEAQPVLGDRRSTLPTRAEPSYSNSRLGRHLQEDASRASRAGKAAATGIEAANDARRAARATALTRVASPVIDIGMEALKPETGAYVTNKLMRDRIDRLATHNPDFDITEEPYAQARSLLSAGEYGKLDALLKQYEK